VIRVGRRGSEAATFPHPHRPAIRTPHRHRVKRRDDRSETPRLDTPSCGVIRPGSGAAHTATTACRARDRGGAVVLSGVASARPGSSHSGARRMAEEELHMRSGSDRVRQRAGARRTAAARGRPSLRQRPMSGAVDVQFLVHPDGLELAMAKPGSWLGGPNQQPSDENRLSWDTSSCRLAVTGPLANAARRSCASLIQGLGRSVGLDMRRMRSEAQGIAPVHTLARSTQASSRRSSRAHRPCSRGNRGATRAQGRDARGSHRREAQPRAARFVACAYRRSRSRRQLLVACARIRRQQMRHGGAGPVRGRGCSCGCTCRIPRPPYGDPPLRSPR